MIVMICKSQCDLEGTEAGPETALRAQGPPLTLDYHELDHPLVNFRAPTNPNSLKFNLGAPNFQIYQYSESLKAPTKLILGSLSLLSLASSSFVSLPIKPLSLLLSLIATDDELNI